MHGNQALRRSHPERAVAGLTESVDPVIAKGGGIAGIENSESDAVETDESLLRPEPQGTILCLCDRVDGVLRKAGVAVPDVVAVQAGVAVPDVVAVLRERCRRMKAVGRRGENPEHGEQRNRRRAIPRNGTEGAMDRHLSPLPR